MSTRTVLRGGRGLLILRTSTEAVLVPGALVLAWALLSVSGLVNPYLVPSPGKVFDAALALSRKGELARHALASLGRVWGGFGMALAFAFPAALAFHFHPRLGRLFRVPLEFLRAVPPLAMIPLLILWLGIGEASKLAVVVLAAFFPIFLSALGGFDGVDGRWLELSRSLELSSPRFLRYVLVPGALPEIVTGLRLGFGYSWRALLGAELFSSASGLGYLVTDAQEMARVDVVFVGIATIGILGLLFDVGLRLLADAASPPAETRNWGSDG